MHDNEIIEGIIAEFKGLAKHPRPSHHEKAVSDYIVSRLHELGVTDVIQDDVYNIVANVPATKGCESCRGRSFRAIWIWSASPNRVSTSTP